MPDHISLGIMIDEGLVEAGRLHYTLEWDERERKRRAVDLDQTCSLHVGLGMPRARALFIQGSHRKQNNGEITHV